TGDGRCEDPEAARRGEMRGRANAAADDPADRSFRAREDHGAATSGRLIDVDDRRSRTQLPLVDSVHGGPISEPRRDLRADGVAVLSTARVGRVTGPTR